MDAESLELVSNSSESCTGNSPGRIRDRVLQWREEWRALADAIREYGGADTLLKRAKDIAGERDRACRIAKKSAVRAEHEVTDAKDALYRAHHAALAGIVPGTKARRSAALRRAELNALAAREAVAEAKVAQSTAWQEVSERANDNAALVSARTRQRLLLANASNCGAFTEDPQLVRIHGEACDTAAVARNYAEAQKDVMDHLNLAKCELSKALFLMLDTKDRGGIELEDTCEIDEIKIAKMLPTARITDAKLAVTAARRAMRSATTNAPDLPLSQEKYVQAALLNAFVRVSRTGTIIPKGFFELASKRIRDALNALSPSIQLQADKCSKANSIKSDLEDKAEALDEALAKRRHDALFSIEY